MCRSGRRPLVFARRRREGDGVTIDPAATYRVTADSFLIGGGDDFLAFNLGTSRDVGLDDLVALQQYPGANNPYAPVATPRIIRLP